jgi:hypothetical protein
MKILAAKSIAGRLRRRTSANGFGRFLRDCGQKAHLTCVYEAASNRHRGVADLLTSPLAPLSESENRKMFVRVELARLEVSDARKALARHVTEHGC